MQEYYGYPTLAELFVYGELHTDTWVSILRHIFRIHDVFRRYPGFIEPQHIGALYSDKTWERLDQLKAQSPYWAELVERETITYNGKLLKNIPLLRDAVCDQIETLVKTAQVCIVHGDFCFSNILFDLNSQIIRLIDPRGSFGRVGIYGDPRYDIAKLRHSICGLYDYIVADMFAISEDGGQLQGEIYDGGSSEPVKAMFDGLVETAGYSIDEIRLIEGLLFVSMVPLHHDNPKRQLMMYATGISLLNEVLL